MINMSDYLGTSDFERLVDDLDYSLSMLAEPVTLTATQLATVRKLILIYSATTLEVDHLRNELSRLEEVLYDERSD